MISGPPMCSWSVDDVEDQLQHDGAILAVADGAMDDRDQGVVQVVHIEVR